MAYVSANLNALLFTPGGGIRQWHYFAGADAQATVRVSGYMTDGAKKGMKVGDLVFVTYTSRAASIHVVVTATLNGPGVSDVVDITDGQAVASTNTD